MHFAWTYIIEGFGFHDHNIVIHQVGRTFGWKNAIIKEKIGFKWGKYLT